jgi:hypothetical protein
LLLLPYCHQPADSPYQASGPIFIRSGARQRIAGPSEVPPYVSGRLMSVRAYDERDFIVDAEVCDGADVAAEIRRMFESPEGALPPPAQRQARVLLLQSRARVAGRL